jgi:hypothetical protein
MLNKPLSLFVAFSVAIVNCFVAFGQMNVTTHSCTQDTYVHSWITPTTGYYNDSILKATTGAIGKRFSIQYYTRSFIEFDLSGIPSNAVVYSAKMKIKRSSAVNGNNPFLLRRITSDWDESLVTSLSNQPQYSTLAADLYDSYVESTDTLYFDVQGLVQRMVYGQVSNFGWTIQVTDETTSQSTGADFYSSNSSYAPVVEVEWYYPLQVTSANIVHESGINTLDGSISPTIGGGASTSYTYSWINSSGNVIGTGSSISGLSAGWYGLRVSGQYGEELFQAFLVGRECSTITIDYQPDERYAENALLINSTYPSSTYPNSNYGNNSRFSTYDLYDGRSGYYNYAKSLLKFNVWLDSDLTIDTANLYLKGANHVNNGNNDAQLQLVERWNESLVTWKSAPDTIGSTVITVPATSSSAEDAVLDILSYVEHWQQNNLDNHGFELTHPSFPHQEDIGQTYQSPTNSTVSYRPRIRFTVSLLHPNNPYKCNPIYAKLYRNLNGGLYKTYSGILYFHYDEEYESPSTNLDYQIFHYTDMVTPIVDGTSNPLVLDYGRKEHKLDLSSTSLVSGQVYILKVTNDKDEKFYLRFKKD